MFKREKNIDEKKSGRMLWIIGIIIVILLGVVVALNLFDNTTSVAFEKLDDDKIPQSITTDIIPEYRGIERALACKVDNDVYLMVTRGEKATSGYGVDVEKVQLEQKDGKRNLVVYALFSDPDGEQPLSQMITYPLKVVKTNLESLPDEIELRIEFSE